jgi:hypothetical protein
MRGMGLAKRLDSASLAFIPESAFEIGSEDPS